jgi:hypothetical protein
VSFWDSGLSYADGGPLNSWGLLTGDSSQVRQGVDLRISSRHWSHTSFHALGFLRTLTAFGTLALFLVRRKDFEYLWFSLNMFCAGVYTWLFLFIAFHSLSQSQYTLWLLLIELAGRLTLLGFYQQLLRSRSSWLFKLAIVFAFLDIPYILQGILWPDILPGEVQISLDICWSGHFIYGSWQLFLPRPAISPDPTPAGSTLVCYWFLRYLTLLCTSTAQQAIWLTAQAGCMAYPWLIILVQDSIFCELNG